MFAMSYLGAERVVANYNVMGPVKAALEAACRYLAYELGRKDIRVHAISPGPLKTRAASGIKDFERLLNDAVERAPLRELVDIEDVGFSLRLSRQRLRPPDHRGHDLHRRRREHRRLNGKDVAMTQPDCSDQRRLFEHQVRRLRRRSGQILLFRGQVEKIGVAPTLTVEEPDGETLVENEWAAKELDHRSATKVILRCDCPAWRRGGRGNRAPRRSWRNAVHSARPG